MRDQANTGQGQLRLELDAKVFEESERLVGYEVCNGLLMLNLEFQKFLGLRVEEYQVFVLIMMSSVQRYVRTADTDPVYRSSMPLPEDHTSSISRRRISEVLDIPFETVRRIVNDMLSRGLIVEPRRGALTTPPGTLQKLSESGKHEQLIRRFVATANALVRLEAIQVLPRD